eukprot:1142222-Pelagomonas_calceolata.AAC.3
MRCSNEFNDHMHADATPEIGGCSLDSWLGRGVCVRPCAWPHGECEFSAWCLTRQAHTQTASSRQAQRTSPTLPPPHTRTPAGKAIFHFSTCVGLTPCVSVRTRPSARRAMCFCATVEGQLRAQVEVWDTTSLCIFSLPWSVCETAARAR